MISISKQELQIIELNEEECRRDKYKRITYKAWITTNILIWILRNNQNWNLNTYMYICIWTTTAKRPADKRWWKSEEAVGAAPVTVSITRWQSVEQLVTCESEFANLRIQRWRQHIKCLDLPTQLTCLWDYNDCDIIFKYNAYLYNYIHIYIDLQDVYTQIYECICVQTI